MRNNSVSKNWIPRTSRGTTVHGFTLLEIIVALFIFSIVSMILISALHNIINNQAATEKNAARLEKLQIALLLLSRDLEQTINRPIITPSKKEEGFLGTSTTVIFTHAGLQNPFNALTRTTLQRTRYQFNDNRLIRTTSPVLDPTENTPFDSRTLLTDVSALQFDYLDKNNKFQPTWPPADQATAVLPRAVRVTLTLKNWGKIHQLYVITGQPLEKPS